MYNFSDVGKDAHALMQQHEAIAATLSEERENVATISIYGATDGILFNGSSAANNWIIEHGFDAFEYGSNVVDLSSVYGGDLLDAGDVHPANIDAAAFFAAIVGNEIRIAGCPADVKEDGVIDIADVLLVVGNWGGQGPTDINDDGTTDVRDLLAVIKGWGDCWPVQAPFNTDTF
jgi:hypothetical protein